MIPTKLEFQELTKSYNVDHLGASLKLVFENDSESKIRAIIEGYDKTLNMVLLNFVYPLPAYKWLNEQPGFKIGQRKVFPERTADWLNNEVASVIRQTDDNLKSGGVTNGNRKTLLRRHMQQVGQKMQSRHHWIGLVSKCLSAYHYPVSPYLGNMRKKTVETGKKIEAALQAILEISKFSEFVPGLSPPNQDMVHQMGALADFLSSENIKELIPINRADSSFMERLFVTQLADGHANLFQCNDGLPAVIADLLYLEGFTNALDERTVRRICAEQADRRSKALLTKKQPSNALSGQLTAKK